MNDGDDDAVDDDDDGGDYDDGGDDDADADDVGTCESTLVAGRLFWQGQARRQRRRSVYLIISLIISFHCLSFTWLPSRPLLKSTRKLCSLANESFEIVLQ